MKVSGKDVANAIAKKLQKEVEKLKVKPTLAIILAGKDPSSKMYVDFKIKRAKEVGVRIKFYAFSEDQLRKCVQTIQELNADKKIHGIIIQYPIYKTWNFDEVFSKIDPKKDVDGFHKESPFRGATAIGVWDMLTAFAYLEGFKTTEKFLTGKNVVVLGRGKTAGGPIIELLQDKGFEVIVVSSKTANPTEVIKSGDVIISATGVKNIVNKTNLKKGAYVIGVGVGKEIVEGKPQVYGDIKEDEISNIAKLYCPTTGGIGPLTIVSLLRNTIEAASALFRK